MKVKIVFDKARGLRPENTDEFFAEYDFQGEWTIAQGKVELDKGEEIIKLHELKTWSKGLDKINNCSYAIRESRKDKINLLNKRKNPRGP